MMPEHARHERGKHAGRGLRPKLRPRLTSKQRQLARLRYLEMLSAPELRRVKREWYLVLCIVYPLVFAFGIQFVAVGVLGGLQVDWEPDAVVDWGRVGGPLWFHLSMAFGIGGILLLGASLGVTDHVKRRPPAVVSLTSHRPS